MISGAFEIALGIIFVPVMLICLAIAWGVIDAFFRLLPWEVWVIVWLLVLLAGMRIG